MLKYNLPTSRQVDGIYGNEDCRDGVHLRGEDVIWWATQKATLLVKGALNVPSSWWSAGSRTKGQDKIKQVKFFFCV